MKAQSKAIVASLVVLALAVCAVSGATYSWWSDTDQSEIQINTAQIDVEAIFKNPGVTASTGGEVITTAVVNDDGGLTVSDLLAGRTVTAEFEITNDSTVPIQYRAYLDFSSIVGYSEYIQLSVGNDSIDVSSGVVYLAGSDIEFDVEDNTGSFFPYSENISFKVSELANMNGVGDISISLVVEAYQSDAVVIPSNPMPVPDTGVGIDSNNNAYKAVNDSDSGIGEAIVTFDSSAMGVVNGKTLSVGFESSGDSGFSIDGSSIVSLSLSNNVSKLGGLASVTVSMDGQIDDPCVYYIDNGNTISEEMTVTDVKYDSVKDMTYVTFITSHFSDFLITPELFDSGIGSEADPFIIADAEQMQNISGLYDSGYYHFQVKDGVSEIDCTDWNSVDLYGSFDGNGVDFINLETNLFRSVGKAPVTDQKVNVISNLDLLEVDISAKNVGVALIYNAGSLLKLEGITISGYIQGTTGASSFIAYGPGQFAEWQDQSYNWTFEDCVSTADVLSITDFSVGFIKHPFAGPKDNFITMNDSIFCGKLFNPNPDNNHYFVGNESTAFKLTTEYSDEFKSKYSAYTLTIYNGVDFVSSYNDGHIYSNTIGYAEGSLPEEIGDEFTVGATVGATSAEALLSISPNDKKGEGAYLGTYMVENLSLSGNEFVTSEIRMFTISVNKMDGSEYLEQGVTGNNYNISDGGVFYGDTYHSAYVRITQYDSNGTVLFITDFKLPKTVQNFDELQDAINNGEGNIVLGGDMDFSSGLVIPSG